MKHWVVLLVLLAALSGCGGGDDQGTGGRSPAADLQPPAPGGDAMSSTETAQCNRQFRAMLHRLARSTSPSERAQAREFLRLLAVEEKNGGASFNAGCSSIKIPVVKRRTP